MVVRWRVSPTRAPLQMHVKIEHTHKFLKKIHQAGKVDIYIKCSQIIAKKRLNDADSFALPVSHLYQN